MKKLLCTVLALSLLLASRSPGTPLPQGAEPEPIAFRHFPNRLYGFIWRNWNLVPKKRLALVVGTTENNIDALAEDLGCGPEKGTFHGIESPSP